MRDVQGKGRGGGEDEAGAGERADEAAGRGERVKEGRREDELATAPSAPWCVLIVKASAMTSGGFYTAEMCEGDREQHEGKARGRERRERGCETRSGLSPESESERAPSPPPPGERARDSFS